MRVFILPLVGATALVLAACSGGTDGTTLQRGRSASSSHAPGATNGAANGGASGGPSAGASNASATSPSAPASPPPSDPAGGSSTNGAGAGTGAGAATTPPPVPAAPPATAPLGSCGNPKCVGANGIAGCKATDGAGDLVTMGCQDGACACFAGGQATTEFAADVNSADDAAQLFLTNCTCN